MTTKLVGSWTECAASTGAHGLPPLLISKGLKAYLLSLVPGILALGPDFVVLHGVFGFKPGQQMNWCSLLQARAHPTLAPLFTDDLIVDAFTAFYAAIGKRPIKVYNGWPDLTVWPLGGGAGAIPERRTELIRESVFVLHKVRQAIYDGTNPDCIGVIGDTFSVRTLKTVVRDPLHPLQPPVETLTEFGECVDACDQWLLPFDVESRFNRTSLLLGGASTAWAFTTEWEDRLADTQAWAAPRSAYGPAQRVVCWQGPDFKLEVNPATGQHDRIPTPADQGYARMVAALKRTGAIAVQLGHAGWTAARMKLDAAK